MRRAFLSHSTADDSYVAEMESFLRAAGFDKVFNDVRAIRADEQFWPAIEKGIADCDTLVVVITAASNASEWVKREVEYARNLSKSIIPVWIEDCPMPSIFDGHRIIDLRPRTRQERRFDIGRIVKYAPAELIGREDETKLLNDAWQKVLRLENGRPHVLTFVALGGEGKTSLVAKWAADLAHQDWPGCDAVFAWSFYSQGTREQTAVSSDLFLAEALTFFGDAAMAGSAQGAFEKGKRLAQLVGERRALLILDGLEPLQYAPTSPTPGELKDQGLGALLKGLAATSHGLCVVTTRYALPDLRAFLGRTVSEEKLTRLARAAGVQLLKAHGVTGSDRRNLPLHDGDAKSELVSEFEKLVEDVDGHALTLHIMGSFLKKAFGGDIRKRDRVTFAKASQKTDNGHAFRAMSAYARWMEDGSDEARRELAILRLMGLFDRPAAADCLAALLAAPAIPGLTEPLTGLSEEDWNCSLASLVAAKLLSVSPETVSVPDFPFPLPASLDAHPLIREYFAERLKEEDKSMKPEGAPTSSFIPHPSAFQLAHRRLYEHLCASTQEGDQPTLEALQPLYQAVAHGCQAGLHEDAYKKVLVERVFGGCPVKGYSWRKLGAVGTDLGALSNFFERYLETFPERLSPEARGEIFGLSGVLLGLNGRSDESVRALKAALAIELDSNRLLPAARAAGSLCSEVLILGRLDAARDYAEDGSNLASRCIDEHPEAWDWKIRCNALLGDVCHQAGNRDLAVKYFLKVENDWQTNSRRMANRAIHGLRGFQYAEFLLAEAERSAWQAMCRGFQHDAQLAGAFREMFEAVTHRAEQSERVTEKERTSLLGMALEHLTLARAALYRAVLEICSDLTIDPLRPSRDLDGPSRIDVAGRESNIAYAGLRRANAANHIPAALLTRAWQRSLTGAVTSAQAGPDSAQSDLDEAWEIAERGPMPLFMADIHLHRARLFEKRKWESGKQDEEDQAYPWASPQHDLAEARRLILKHGYLRRMEELEDAERALLP